MFAFFFVVLELVRRESSSLPRNAGISRKRRGDTHYVNYILRKCALIFYIYTQQPCVFFFIVSEPLSSANASMGASARFPLRSALDFLSAPREKVSLSIIRCNRTRAIFGFFFFLPLQIPFIDRTEWIGLWANLAAGNPSPRKF